MIKLVAHDIIGMFEKTHNYWYHSSYYNNIKKFSTRRNKDKLGAYFSDDINVAKRMHGSLGSYLYKVTLNVKKTLDLSMYKEDSNTVSDFLDKLPVSDYFKRNFIYNSGTKLVPYKTLEWADNDENIIPKLKKRGYDSIKFHEDGGNTIVVFKSDVIKIIEIITI